MFASGHQRSTADTLKHFGAAAVLLLGFAIKGLRFALDW